jgi:hypothetical protein
MEAPSAFDATATQPVLARILQAAGRLDTASKFAILCLLFGWFFLDTLVVSLGSLQHGVRFFDMWAVIAEPTRVFFGVDTGFQRIAFGLLCIACLLAPLAAQLSPRRSAWLAQLLPLALILVCGTLLYSQTSSEFFAASGDPSSVGNSLIRLANDLARQGSGFVTKHISVAGGAYLALIGAVVLALKGVRGFRGSTAANAR